MADDIVAATHNEPPVLRLNDKDWFLRLGQVAKSIGSREFHHELVDLFGASIRHDSCWIIRFSSTATPEVLFTNNVADEVVRTYRKSYSELDPFSDYWRNFELAGVTMLAQAKAQSRRTAAYSQVFLPQANISDEMSIFLPTVGRDCFGLFLERESGQFSKADVERARLVFPTLEGCHRAHIAWVFNNLRDIGGMELNGFATKPMLIQDRFGAEVYSNDAWNEAHVGDALKKLVEAFPVHRGTQSRSFGDFVLKFELLDRDFPLAPGGRMFVLETNAAAAQTTEARGAARALFTPREYDVFSLMMKGRTTGEIAQTLEISKGVIKNYKLRIYRKADVTSERALVRKFTSV
jgi:DNA-binding CsgD family transcriptional regulator